jgi:hypothetical protein
VKILLPRLGGGHPADGAVDGFEGLVAADRFRLHSVTGDPDDADVVLFTQCHAVDWRLRAIREHPLALRFWEKVMVYDERDRPWRSFPGVYVSVPARRLDAAWQRPWAYAYATAPSAVAADPDLLFSFVGGASSPAREPLFGLRHAYAVIERIDGYPFWDAQAPGHAERRASYQATLARSRFVLCPRGRGPSTIRLYETLAAGRVPVIISDDWAAPKGPDWKSFSLRWPEGKVGGLVEMLEERDRDWPQMSAEASEAHREFFAPDVAFHRITDLCAELRRQGARPEGRRRLRRRALAAALLERSRVVGKFGHPAGRS